MVLVWGVGLLLWSQQNSAEAPANIPWPVGNLFIFFFFFFFSLVFLGPHLQHMEARGRIGAVAAGLRHSHSNTGSEPHLQPTP